jgi:hypothetical protein
MTLNRIDAMIIGVPGRAAVCSLIQGLHGLHVGIRCRWMASGGQRYTCCNVGCEQSLLKLKDMYLGEKGSEWAR